MLLAELVLVYLLIERTLYTESWWLQSHLDLSNDSIFIEQGNQKEYIHSQQTNGN
jgi:hypothetical protein